MHSFREVNAGGVVYMRAGNITAAHGFTTRYGGVSRGIFESLNFSQNRGDELADVAENYRRLGEAVGFDPGRMALSYQVHGRRVRTVTAAEAQSPFDPVTCECDALVTAEFDLPLIVFTADCVPVLLHDPSAQVIAAAHAGWRGTGADIMESTVSAMLRLGATAGNIRAAIGPANSVCCYETGADVADVLYALLGSQAQNFVHPKPPDKYMIDLKGANRQRLIQLGVAPDNIAVSTDCTSCLDVKYWSHRKTMGQRGSQAAVIVQHLGSTS